MFNTGKLYKIHRNNVEKRALRIKFHSEANNESNNLNGTNFVDLLRNPSLQKIKKSTQHENI